MIKFFRRVTLVLIFCFVGLLFNLKNDSVKLDYSSVLFKGLKKTLVLFSGQHIILADLSTARLYLFKWYSAGYCLSFACTFSASKARCCNIMDSLGTPLGWHFVCEKIGYNIPLGGEFIGRKFTGVIVPKARSLKERGRILTRVLRLKGCEWGKNLGVDSQGRCCDTYRRCVYIHGTSLEDLIPQPLSCGCLLLKTDHLLYLFDQVSVGALCCIRK